MKQGDQHEDHTYNFSEFEGASDGFLEFAVRVIQATMRAIAPRLGHRVGKDVAIKKPSMMKIMVIDFDSFACPFSATAAEWRDGLASCRGFVPC